MDLVAGDVYEIGPGHDSWVVGDEPYVTVSWEGARTWAVRCAIDIQTTVAELGLKVRAGIHTGEVDLVGKDVRGIAVHEAARIAGAAGAGETLVSEVTRALASSSGATFGPGVSYDLKGIEGARLLYPVVDFA